MMMMIIHVNEKKWLRKKEKFSIYKNAKYVTLFVAIIII